MTGSASAFQRRLKRRVDRILRQGIPAPAFRDLGEGLERWEGPGTGWARYNGPPASQVERTERVRGGWRAHNPGGGVWVIPPSGDPSFEAAPAGARTAPWRREFDDAVREGVALARLILVLRARVAQLGGRSA